MMMMILNMVIFKFIQSQSHTTSRLDAIHPSSMVHSRSFIRPHTEPLVGPKLNNMGQEELLWAVAAARYSVIVGK